MKRTFGDNIVLTVTSRKVHKRRVCCWLIFRSVRQCASEDHQTYRRPLSKPIQGDFVPFVVVCVSAFADKTDRQVQIECREAGKRHESELLADN